MRLRNEVFCQAIDYLAGKELYKGQKDLAMRAGLTQTTLSRIMTGKVEPSDETLRKFNSAFGCIFNMQWLRGIDPYYMLASDALGGSHVKQKEKDEEGALSLIELASRLIKEVELLRKNLQDEREQTRILNEQLMEAMKKIESFNPSRNYLMASENN